MATRFSSALNPDSSTNAKFQAWVQFIEDLLVTTGGWVVTADTGQTLPSALIAPTAANQKRGYRIYRMSDALQATSPVFMRFDFGSAGAVALPGIWFTIGTGSDGSGNITGIVFNGGANASPNTGCNSGGSGGASLVTNCYGSAASNRVSWGMFVNSGSAIWIWVFALERTKDATGSDTGLGLLLVYNDPATQGGGGIGNTLHYSRFLVLAGGAQPAMEVGLSYVLSTNNPSQTFAPGDIGVGVVLHFRGVVQQPGVNVMICNSSDVSNEAFISMTIYGVAHTYQHMNIMTPGKRKTGSGTQGTIDSGARVLIRYD